MPEPAQDQRFWQMPAAGILRALNELKTHRVQIRFFHYDRYSHHIDERIRGFKENIHYLKNGYIDFYQKA